MVHERQSETAVATAMWPTRHVSVLAVVSLTVGLVAGYLLLGGAGPIRRSLLLPPPRRKRRAYILP